MTTTTTTPHINMTLGLAPDKKIIPEGVFSEI